MASPAKPAPANRTSSTSSVQPSLVTGELCRSLSTTGAWHCESVSGSIEPGPVSYYTRIASAQDTVVEHVWYWNGRVHQRVDLRIRANPSGFRTYSRARVSPEHTGEWKVELRTRDGRVLDEESFTVR